MGVGVGGKLLGAAMPRAAEPSEGGLEPQLWACEEPAKQRIAAKIKKIEKEFFIEATLI